MPPAAAPPDLLPDLLAGGGALGVLIAAFDWAATPLGAIDAWPQSLRTTVALILRSPVPIVTLWGEDGIMIYNDAYSLFAGKRHPQLLGSKVREGWAEIADFNDHVMKVGLGGGTLAYRDQELVLERDGTPAPVWMDLDYSPVIGEDGRPAGVIAIVVETTAKVRAERRISSERERLRRMFEQAPGFMATLTGPDHVIETVNAAFVEAVGVRGAPGVPLREVLPEMAAQGLLATLDRIYATGQPFVGRQAALTIEREPGVPVIHYVDFVAQPLRDEAGAVSGIFVTGYDVTALKQTQQQLELAQRAGHVGTFELYPETRQVDVSPEFCRLWGLPVQPQVALDDLIALVHPDDRWRIRSTGVDTSSIVLGSVEYRVVLASTGEVRWLARRGEVFDDLHGRRYTGVVFDITDRRLAEEQLQLLNETLEQRVADRTAERDGMWRLSTDVMLVADFSGRIRAVNPAWTAVLGWSAEEAIGRPLHEFVHPDDIARTAAEVSSLERGVRTLRFENRYRHRDGHYRWLSWTASPSEDLLHAVGRDIQPEKEAQEALARAEEALRQSQKMEAVGQLTGGIAHDFNNLLTIVTGNIDMACRALAKAELAEPRADRALANAMKGAERAAALTQRLLAFSRRQPLAPCAIEVAQLVDGMSDLLTRALGETVRLVVNTAADLWPVDADPNQLESAILNLAVNARDAMPDGGTLTIAAANATGDGGEAARCPIGDHVLITVTDTGEGMTAETIAHVFEPFFTTKEVGKGTGLGLSMVYGFVAQSGGEVRIESAPGAGTTVCICLPRLEGAMPAAAEACAPVPAVERAAPCETILAVEDDDDVRAYTVSCLRELGYRVLEAQDGPSALACLDDPEAAGIDLLFTDVVMPGMSGRELADAARQLRPALRVLYTSGYTRDAIVGDGRLEPGVALLPKPFAFAALAEKIRALLDG